MHKILTACVTGTLSLALVGTGLQAGQRGPQGQQQPPTAQQRQEQAQKRLAEMAERLGLSDEQKEQIKPILAENAKKMRSLREEFRNQERSEESTAEMRQALQDLHKETRAQMEEILDDKQMAEYDKMIAERRQQRRAAADDD